MSIPVTRNAVSPDAEAEIRARVRAVQGMDRGDGRSRIVTPDDANALFEFFAHPEVSGPIYTIEKPVTQESVARHIARKSEAQQRGEGLLTAVFDQHGQIISYMDHQVWPHWSACEFGGAMLPTRQSRGEGRTGIFTSIDWVYDTLGVDLLCFTAAKDNIRSIKLIDAMGLRRMGETVSTSPDGQTRQSLVWEMTRAEWQSAKQAMTS